MMLGESANDSLDSGGRSMTPEQRRRDAGLAFFILCCALVLFVGLILWAL